MSWINTNSGKHFNLSNPKPWQICIDDIACALSNICRFTGQLTEFYSVAQHSVLASHIVPPEFAFEALMHDAAEAYLGDVSSPLKVLLPDYRKIERVVEIEIRAKFWLPAVMSSVVKHADLTMLATERRDFNINDGIPWPILEGIKPLPSVISPLSPRQALAQFLNRFYELSSDHEEPCPMNKFECDICGLITTASEGQHYCAEDNSCD
ncbi:HD family hydrolase [Tatumella punctata]|uniref:HD family hydrolase n=1 Tax=Tatumella punctata TaxID=399969 RepID=A0ABW1VLY1_9GAMM